MIILGLLIAVAFIPGWTGASLPTGWAVMSLTLPWLIWKRVPITPFHLLGWAFLAYAFASFTWAPRGDDAVLHLWHLTLLGLAFGVGFRLRSSEGVFVGLGIGMSISSGVAIAQYVGWHYFNHFLVLPLSDWSKPSGLFYNDAVAGACAALVLVGLLIHRKLWLAAGVFPSLWLAHSRGAWLAFIATYVVAFAIELNQRQRLTLFGFLSPFLALGCWLFLGWPSDSIRLVIWSTMLQHLHWLGDGAGASQSLYLLGPQTFHVEHAHNDYLDLAYQFGLGCLPLAGLAAWLSTRRNVPEWPVFVCCLVLAAYFWVLFSPVTCFILGVVAGRLARVVPVDGANSDHRGLGTLPRGIAGKLVSSPTRGSAVPVELGS